MPTNSYTGPRLRCEPSWGEPERDMTVSTRLSDSVFSETYGLENALKSEYE